MVGLVLVAFLAAVACCGYFLWMKMRGAEMVGAAGTKLFLVEFVVVVVPYFAVVFVGTGALVVVGATSGVWSFLGALLLAVAAVTPMICGFRLSLTYLRKGRDALRRVPMPWWWGMALGATVPLVGLLALLLKWVFGDFAIEAVSENQPFGPMRVSQLSVGLLFAPLLLPLLHLLREKSAGERSNT